MTAQQPWRHLEVPTCDDCPISACWTQLPEVRETREPPPDQTRRCLQVLHSHAFPAAMGLARSGRIAPVQRVLDVGGGTGCFGIALALVQPDLRCTVLERPGICRLADRYIAAYGVQDRVSTQAANLFEDAWPSGHDAIFFSTIFHDWGWEDFRCLVERSFAALPPGGHIYLHEKLLAAKDGPRLAPSCSTTMLLFEEGTHCTAGDLDQLLSHVGFADIAVFPAYGFFSLISGRKPWVDTEARPLTAYL
jgi:acetylserotonin N-methyltransferase